MIELPDDELDKLFRKSSEELDPQFEPEDWSSLKKRLDQHDGRTPGAWLKKWWPLGMLGLFLTVGTVWFALSDKPLNLKAAEKTGRSTQTLATENNDTAAAGKESEYKGTGDTAKTSVAKENKMTEDVNGPIASVNKPIASVNKPNASIKKPNAAADQSIANTNRPATASNEPTEAADQPNAAVGNVPAASGQKLKGSKSIQSLPRSQSKTGGVYLEASHSKRNGGDGAISFEREERENGGRGGIEGGAGRDSGEVAKKIFVSASMLNARPLVWEYQGAKPEVAAPEMPPMDVPKVKTPAPESPLWAVRAGYAPDLSTIGMKNFTKPGTAVSLLAEYLIIPRAYIQTGVIWSRKKYFGYGKDYQIDHYYGPDIKSVDGTCDVLEIPVNLRVDALVTARSLLFAGAGISSYRMLKEKYKYSFENEYDPRIKARGWQGNSGWTFLNHLNASVGYERKISQNLSILAEPYVRVPLKKVGYGNVNLFTTGLWISLRYAPVLK